MPFKGFNSKRFLLLYLAVIAFMLILWLMRLNWPVHEHRPIPNSLGHFLLSPAISLPQFLLNVDNKQVLTNQTFVGKWSFVYFSHPDCGQECTVIMEVLSHLQALSANRDRQFYVINFDINKQGQLERYLHERGYRFPVAEAADQSMLDLVTSAFQFLYLSSEAGQGDGQSQQQHFIYLVDPKARVYAVFKPPFTSLIIQQRFFELRDFYARTE